eukprot:CFRG7440T1
MTDQEREIVLSAGFAALYEGVGGGNEGNETVRLREHHMQQSSNGKHNESFSSTNSVAVGGSVIHPSKRFSYKMSTGAETPSRSSHALSSHTQHHQNNGNQPQKNMKSESSSPDWAQMAVGFENAHFMRAKNLQTVTSSNLCGCSTGSVSKSGEGGCSGMCEHSAREDFNNPKSYAEDIQSMQIMHSNNTTAQQQPRAGKVLPLATILPTTMPAPNQLERDRDRDRDSGTVQHNHHQQHREGVNGVNPLNYSQENGHTTAHTSQTQNHHRKLSAKEKMAAARRRRHSVDLLEFAGLNGCDTSTFLRHIRLHKYTLMLNHLSFATLMQMDDDGLVAAGMVAQGARTRLLKAIDRYKVHLEAVGGGLDASDHLGNEYGYDDMCCGSAYMGRCCEVRLGEECRCGTGVGGCATSLQPQQMQPHQHVHPHARAAHLHAHPHLQIHAQTAQHYPLHSHYGHSQPPRQTSLGHLALGSLSRGRTIPVYCPQYMPNNHFCKDQHNPHQNSMPTTASHTTPHQQSNMQQSGVIQTHIHSQHMTSAQKQLNTSFTRPHQVQPRPSGKHQQHQMHRNAQPHTKITPASMYSSYPISMGSVCGFECAGNGGYPNQQQSHQKSNPQANITLTQSQAVSHVQVEPQSHTQIHHKQLAQSQAAPHVQAEPQSHTQTHHQLVPHQHLQLQAALSGKGSKNAIASMQEMRGQGPPVRERSISSPDTLTYYYEQQQRKVRHHLKNNPMYNTQTMGGIHGNGNGGGLQYRCGTLGLGSGISRSLPVVYTNPNMSGGGWAGSNDTAAHPIVRQQVLQHSSPLPNQHQANSSGTVTHPHLQTQSQASLSHPSVVQHVDMDQSLCVREGEIVRAGVGLSAMNAGVGFMTPTPHTYVNWNGFKTTSNNHMNNTVTKSSTSLYGGGKGDVCVGVSGNSCGQAQAGTGTGVVRRESFTYPPHLPADAGGMMYGIPLTNSPTSPLTPTGPDAKSGSTNIASSNVTGNGINRPVQVISRQPPHTLHGQQSLTSYPSSSGGGESGKTSPEAYTLERLNMCESSARTVDGISLCDDVARVGERISRTKSQLKTGNEIIDYTDTVIVEEESAAVARLLSNLDLEVERRPYASKPGYTLSHNNIQDDSHSIHTNESDFLNHSDDRMDIHTTNRGESIGASDNELNMDSAFGHSIMDIITQPVQYNSYTDPAMTSHSVTSRTLDGQQSKKEQPQKSGQVVDGNINDMDVHGVPERRSIEYWNGLADSMSSLQLKC